jgi:hypothetical protein
MAKRRLTMKTIPRNARPAISKRQMGVNLASNLLAASRSKLEIRSSASQCIKQLLVGDDRRMAHGFFATIREHPTSAVVRALGNALNREVKARAVA